MDVGRNAVTEEVSAQFIVASEVMRCFMRTVERVASHAGNVLIIGETGTGKERVAQTIHTHSLRSNKPFVEINCAALPEHLVESELFGYEKGAFSGANTNKPGLFEVAQGGSIFLDEIGELDIKIQGKLLRVLDRSPYFRLGGNRKITADVRVVAATNRNLKQEVSAGRFRKDLYHRLAQFELFVPPLRERLDDIGALVRHVVEQSGHHVQISDKAMDKLLAYAWPGNVRELQNVVNKLLFASTGDTIDVTDVDDELSRASQETNGESDKLEHPAGPTVPRGLNDRQMTSDVIQRALANTGGHKGQAAAQLGISRRTLSRKLRSFGLPPARLSATMVKGSLSDEERQHFRAEMKVTAFLLTEDGRELSCTTANLGMSGMGVEGLQAAIPSRSNLVLRFQLPGVEERIEASGRVAWADKLGCAGIIFTQLGPAARHLIDGWLYRKIMEEGWSVDTEAKELLSAPFVSASSYTH